MNDKKWKHAAAVWNFSHTPVLVGVCCLFNRFLCAGGGAVLMPISRRTIGNGDCWVYFRKHGESYDRPTARCHAVRQVASWSHRRRNLARHPTRDKQVVCQRLADTRGRRWSSLNGWRRRGRSCTYNRRQPCRRRPMPCAAAMAHKRCCRKARKLNRMHCSSCLPPAYSPALSSSVHRQDCSLSYNLCSTVWPFLIIVVIASLVADVWAHRHLQSLGPVYFIGDFQCILDLDSSRHEQFGLTTSLDAA